MGTTSALLSWQHVAGMVDDEQALTEWRQEVTAFGGAVREQYVHQAHVFIDRGPGHLDHYALAEAEAEQRLERLTGLPVPGSATRLEELRASYLEFEEGFQREAIPEIRAGSMSRETAGLLHGRSEARANEVERQVLALVHDLDAAEEAQRRGAARAVSWAWWVTASALLLGLALVGFVLRRLAWGVLHPLDALREATARFAEGDASVRVPLSGEDVRDDEIAALAVAFNHMVERVVGAEEQRVRAERLAALGEMSAAVAHELLNPLTVILGTTQDPTVRAEAGYARQVVQGLLGFARPGEERPVSVDLRDAVDQVLTRLGPLADAAGVSLVASGGACTVLASPSAIRQVLDNLVRNAVEASPEGERVEVAVSEGEVRVLDRGSGIPEIVRARLYEPFVTGRPTGTGLGLAVASRVARAMGGELTHHDRPGGGTQATWQLGGRDG